MLNNQNKKLNEHNKELLNLMQQNYEIQSINIDNTKQEQTNNSTIKDSEIINIIKTLILQKKPSIDIKNILLQNSLKNSNIDINKINEVLSIINLLKNNGEKKEEIDISSLKYLDED